MVIRQNPKPGNAKRDFLTLRAQMISKKFYDKYLGEMIEAVPPISEKDFKRLQERNPFDEGRRSIGQTFKVLVE